MTAFPWTKEQVAVLDSTDRITLVQAGPGSGKTRVFAEVVDRRLRAWPQKRGGLAALSFTNVARDEIEQRVCASTVAPHFVGTLDAFFLRFVIGPFGHLAGLPKSGARLIPSPLDQQLSEPTVQLGEKLFPSIFQITATGGTETAPAFQYKLPNLPPRDVPAQLASTVLKRKQGEWKIRGRVTHGDCSYLASCILNGAHGPAVRAILARRFPVICIDEFQDTGHFLGSAILAMLRESAIQALVVGDIDQKIFGFSGVNPNLFAHVEALPGARKYPLQISQRCAVDICAAASLLSRSGGKVLPAEGAPSGQAIMTTHTDAAAPGAGVIQRAIYAARLAKAGNLAVLVRKRVTRAGFLRTIASGPSVSGRGVAQVTRALDGLRDGKGRSAIDIAQALICRILLDDDRPTEDELRAAGIEPAVLRRRVRHALLQLMDLKPGETWGQWSVRTKQLCEEIAYGFGIGGYKQRLGAQFRTNKTKDKPDRPRTVDAMGGFAWPADLPVEVLTVHEAKGREFDAVAFYCPRPGKQGGTSACPSEAWWALPVDSEEREVAFVATTRAKRLLLLVVHEATHEALKSGRADFFAAFAPLLDFASPAPADASLALDT